MWNNIVGSYSPDGPLLDGRLPELAQRPGRCADYHELGGNQGALLPGPPQIVQYNSTQYDDDYAC